eukprot:gnl/TRDRNA2_/TRDRNA2_44640_c0_seq1.p1 gnl/TRDRNA2_/TRDRNA2_44640_c0~~gnl/TRDRNA2_/TRDRNA2_44640_c0_seq1.p1  ORF type:complete len:627 (+),score=139.66 gnl/TRDRNA2_/TRDRNA2_44640_c0_seq1:125-2005(+)
MPAAMDVDADAALDGFLSKNADARRRAAEALERWRVADPGGLAISLAGRVVNTRGDDARVGEMRALAAVLLRKVILKSADALSDSNTTSGGSWCHAGLGDALLEALSASASNPVVGRHVADAAAVAASVQFVRGRAWPEFALLLAKWCTEGCAERAAVLRILEQLSDEADEEAEDAACADAVAGGGGNDGDEAGAAAGSKRRAPSSSVGAREGALGCQGRASSLYSLLAFLEDHGGALHSLLGDALSEPGDDSSRDAAARIYSLCVAGTEVPSSLRESVRDLAPLVASVAASAPGQACLHAVALAARGDPGAWCRGGGAAISSLPTALASTVVSQAADAGVRSAALMAMLELQAAAPDADELVALSSKTVADVLTSLPPDEATDDWAEVPEDAPPASDGCEGLLEDVLDAVARLAARGGRAAAELQRAALDLAEREAWQSRHASLLIHLHLAAGDNEEPAAAATMLAGRNLWHVHPRVRWAALEVWARLLDAGFATPRKTFSEAFELLVSAAGRDPYTRVRRRGMLTLLVAATCADSPLKEAHAEPVFRQVLIPQAASQDAAIRQACVDIAVAIAGAAGLVSEGTDSEPSVGGWLSGLWAELMQAASAFEQEEDSPEEIKWPAEWR